MGKQIMMHTNNGSHKREPSIHRWCNLDEHGKHYGKGKKPDTPPMSKNHILYDAFYMVYLE